MVLAPRAKNGVLGAGLQGKSGVHPVHPAQLAIAGYRTETWHLDVPEVVKRRGWVWALPPRRDPLRAPLPPPLRAAVAAAAASASESTA